MTEQIDRITNKVITAGYALLYILLWKYSTWWPRKEDTKILYGFLTYTNMYRESIIIVNELNVEFSAEISVEGPLWHWIY